MKAVVTIAAALLSGAWLYAQAPTGKVANTPAPAAEIQAGEALSRAGGLPPRATPGDYQFRTQAGKTTIAAEFTGHSIATLEGGPYICDDFVVVEVGLFGPSGAKLPIGYQDFSLRVNGKKTPLPADPYLSIFKSLKDPDWDDPNTKEGTKTSLNSGGGNTSDPPRLIHMPIERQRTMQARVVKVSLGEGEHPLPQAGFLYFEYHGEVKSIRSLELIYNGPAGKASLELHR